MCKEELNSRLKSSVSLPSLVEHFKPVSHLCVWLGVVRSLLCLTCNHTQRWCHGVLECTCASLQQGQKVNHWTFSLCSSSCRNRGFIFRFSSLRLARQDRRSEFGVAIIDGCDFSSVYTQSHCLSIVTDTSQYVYFPPCRPLYLCTLLCVPAKLSCLVWFSGSSGFSYMQEKCFVHSVQQLRIHLVLVG